MPEELNLDIMNNENVAVSLNENTEELQSAGFSERFFAYVIDTMPFVFLAYFTYNFSVKSAFLEASVQNLKVWKIAWIVLFFIYEIILSSGGRATLGKWIVGIRVISKNGGPLSMAMAFVRTIGYFIGSLTINLGYLIALFTPQKKALHDYMALSRVVKVKQRPDFVEGAFLVVSWALMAFFIGSWVQRTVLTATPSEMEQINKARRTVSKLAKLEEIHFQKFGFYTDDIKRLADLTRNIPAVRKELSENLSENTLEIATNGKNYIISAKAKNWRKTKVEISSLTAQQPPQ